MKFHKLFFAIVALITANTAVCMNKTVEAIDRSRIKEVTVECLGFDDSTKKITFGVMDVVSESAKCIFRDLFDERFPIYTASCFAPREVRSGSLISMHAYGAAIDINYLMNPYFDAVEFSMIPERLKDRKEDEESIRKGLASIVSAVEIDTIVKTVITEQPQGSDDRFLNRGNLRKGMITPEVISTFRKYGFDVWGGYWRQPMDYMHFQMPRQLAEVLVANFDPDKCVELWENHVNQL